MWRCWSGGSGQRFGEYRTQRYVLQAFGQLQRNELPNLEDECPSKRVNLSPRGGAFRA